MYRRLGKGEVRRQGKGINQTIIYTNTPTHLFLHSGDYRFGSSFVSHGLAFRDALLRIEFPAVGGSQSPSSPSTPGLAVHLIYHRRRFSEVAEPFDEKIVYEVVRSEEEMVAFSGSLYDGCVSLG